VERASRLAGWPETWWAFHKVMPRLAEQYRVISVDFRGMGTSDKPAGGYDKKTMAQDIYELMRHFGYEKVSLVGHDIGATIAFSFAANYPEATGKLVMLDVPHPDASLASWPLLPTYGTFGDKIDPDHACAWWFAFHSGPRPSRAAARGPRIPRTGMGLSLPSFG
jgi:pimeloyl-ACP methyl ester carboxylesterase